MSEAPGIPHEVAAAIKLVVLDVDGVMTDGGIYLGASPSGEAVELKRFEITDGLGIVLLQRAGIEVAIVTGRSSEVVAMRARELNIQEVHQDPAAEKLPIVQGILERKNLRWNAVACLADDLADIPVLRRAGLPVAVANAVPEVKAAAVWRTCRSGGTGAVREFAEALLRTRDVWSEVVEAYLRDRDGGDGAA